MCSRRTRHFAAFAINTQIASIIPAWIGITRRASQTQTLARGNYDGGWAKSRRSDSQPWYFHLTGREELLQAGFYLSSYIDNHARRFLSDERRTLVVPAVERVAERRCRYLRR